jgi:serine/threonine protein kinase
LSLKGRMSVQPGTPSETAHSLERVRDALERRYRVERELGSGRTGTVYLAYDRRRGRKVAVRVLSPSLAADPEKREAFVRAAKAARFSDPSPYMVRIRTVGHAAGIVYATLDYVDGETLGEWLRREGPLTVSTATRLLYHVARGVGCAHGAGVIIGGLTPDDVILERTTGRPVVTNVGIARAVAESAYSAARAPFMSPEQVQGAAGDERSDVYALGVTAYFAVTGYLPFEGHTPGEVYMGYVIHGPGSASTTRMETTHFAGPCGGVWRRTPPSGSRTRSSSPTIYGGLPRFRAPACRGTCTGSSIG